MENSKPYTTHSLWAFFILAFGFAWLFWLPPVLAAFGSFSMPIPVMVWVIIGAHGPLIAALVMTYQSDGWVAVRQLLCSGFNLRMKPTWWIAIIFIPVTLAALSVWTNAVLNGHQPDTSLLAQPLIIMPTFFVMFFVGGSFQEEFGWRGYALTRLLAKWNPLIASLLLGVIWGVWHLPLFYIPGVSQSFMPFGVFLLLTIGFSIFFTWFFLRTNRNLFSALLLHTVINTSFSLFPPIEQKMGGNQMALTYLMIAYLCISVVMIVKEFTLWRTKTLASETAPENAPTKNTFKEKL